MQTYNPPPVPLARNLASHRRGRASCSRAPTTPVRGLATITQMSNYNNEFSPSQLALLYCLLENFKLHF